MKSRLLIMSLLSAVLFGSIEAHASQSKAIALALKVSGDVSYRKANTDQVDALKLGTALNDGDWVKTGKDAFLVLIFTDDKTVLKMREFTEATIQGKRDNKSNISKRISIELGQMYAKVEQQRGSLQIATPTSVASVKGTEFWIVVLADGTTQVLTLEGLVELMSRRTGQVVDVQPGQRGAVNPQGEIERRDVLPEEIPNDPAPDAPEAGNIQIQIQDENGRTRTINIDYNTQDGEE